MLFYLEEAELVALPNRVTKKAVLGDTFGAVDFGVDDFGANDIALDYNTSSGADSAFRLMIHSDALENHRDFYDGDRLGINPTMKIKLSDRTIVDLSYEHADHERYIDRGIPTENGKPVERFSQITFGDSRGDNLTTLEADIFRAIVSTNFSDATKANLTIVSSEFEKCIKTIMHLDIQLAVSVVTVDGYNDPTERENTIISGNLN